MIDHSHLKLGRVAPTPEQRKKALPFERYMMEVLPKGKPFIHNADGAPIAMWDNDKIGDCAIAGLANLAAIRSKIEGLPFNITTAAVREAYFEFTGGKDVGAVETEVLTRAAHEGFNFGEADPWKVAVWTSVSIRDVELCKSLISIFGALYLGVALPLAAQTQDIWTKPIRQNGKNTPNSWGGHALLTSGYNEQNIFDLVTWGDVKLAELGWLNAYCDEAYVLIDANAVTSALVDYDALLADWRALRAA